MAQSQLLSTCLQELEQKSHSHKSAWQLGEELSWSINQNDKTIIFHFADGYTVSAPVQIIGTYDIEHKTFLWGWANKSIHEDLAEHSSVLRDFALKGKHDALLQELSPMSEHQAWQYTALVVKMVNAFGAYRGQIKGSYIFMTFGSIFCNYTEGTQKRDETENIDYAADGALVQRKDLINFIQGYFKRMFAIEQNFQQQQNKNQPEDYKLLVERSIEQMNVVYDECWLREDNFHKPCAVSWPSDYDLSQTRQWQIFDIGHEIYRITYLIQQPIERRNSLYIKVNGDDVKIIDFQYDSCDAIKDKPA